MTDLVVMSLEGWDEVWRRNQHLVSGLLATDTDLRVLFVEPPVDPLFDVSRGRRPSAGRRVTQIPGVADGRLWRYRPVKWLPRRIDPHGDERRARAVRRAARGLGMRRTLLWINDLDATTLSIATGWPTLYDMTDDWLAADRPSAELRRIGTAEEYLLTHAAEVVACSAELLRRKNPQRPSDLAPITLIPNAVDVADYRQPMSRPADMPSGAVAVYVGTLHEDRLDVDVCVHTARSLGKDATLVLVGPNALGTAETTRLQESGAILLGPRSRTDVIAYLQHADVLIVPHLVNDFTDSLDPIKLYEYEAVARPVVSTAVAGFRESDSPLISIADAPAFGAAVAVQVRQPPAMPSLRLVPDWTERVSQMRQTLARMALRI